MGKTNRSIQKGILGVGMGVLIVALLVSAGFNVYFASAASSQQSTSDSSSYSTSDSALQSSSDSSSQSVSSSSSQSSNAASMISWLQLPDSIYIMEAGILYNHLAFRDGESREFTYDFTNDEYAELKSKYRIDNIAGDGTEFEKAVNLMDRFAPLLKHKSDYDNHVEMNAMALLEYSLTSTSEGINCRAKAQILNEMCLALNIYARKVWIMPNSGYDNDCHVVNEVWDSTLNKWVMLDITNNEYWVDETGTPLSILEIRNKGTKQEFCTPVYVGDKLDDLQKLKEKHMGDFLYIMKNMAWMRYCADYTVGESETTFDLLPANLRSEAFHLEEDKMLLISQASVEKSPIQ